MEKMRPSGDSAENDGYFIFRSRNKLPSGSFKPFKYGVAPNHNTNNNNNMASWNSLPVELCLQIVDNLDLDNTRAFSTVDQRTHTVCVPLLFRHIKLDQLDAFVQQVPSAYCRHIQHLDIAVNNGSVPHLISILKAAPRLSQLVLRLNGAIGHEVIPFFGNLACLGHLTIRNCADEIASPLSERLVTSIAATVPRLRYLHLERVSRSTLHSPELIGKFPHVPLVKGDEDIPDHPILGSALSLPSLLSIPTLRQLIIRDTHLGDPLWATAPVHCRLEVLDLGSCVHEAPTPNRLAIERIMSAVGPSLSAFSLPTALASPPRTPLPCLRALHISPFVPPDEVADTITTLAASPIEALSVQCFGDDLADACSALETFLALRAERGPAFFGKLARIDVAVAADDVYSSTYERGSEHDKAAQRLQEFCKNLHLTSCVPVPSCKPKTDRGRSNSCAFFFFFFGDSDLLLLFSVVHRLSYR
ncbi:hypothetical protein MKEN_00597100 [Mycena kentingensis (nom. inval.)]|nr:hypothetical protein MKEN_00597100 [Mycena kentingensis (nom. inval.)]